MLLQLTAILLYYTSLVSGQQQQCSYVTVPICGDDVTVTPGSLVSGRGQKGVAGPPGKLGPKGLPGPKGGQGLVGPKGDVGPPGKIGRRGRAGPKGSAGPVGPKGDVGPPGQFGSRGTVGEKGSKGAVGPKGEALDLEELKREMRERLQEIDNRFFSCLMSRKNGYQLLRNKGVVCDDGWTVFQKRFDGSVDFNRTWQEYKDGFGNMQGEFWLGLDEIHRMTSGQNCTLKVKLVGFDQLSAYAQYNSFSIDDESDNYRLHVSGYNGTAGDSLKYNGYPFTTKDRDNDGVSSSNCALGKDGTAAGGWWYYACSYSKLNAEWGRSQGYYGIVWYHWRGYNKRIKESTMMIRCI